MLRTLTCLALLPSFLVQHLMSVVHEANRTGTASLSNIDCLILHPQDVDLKGSCWQELTVLLFGTFLDLLDDLLHLLFIIVLLLLPSLSLSLVLATLLSSGSPGRFTIRSVSCRPDLPMKIHSHLVLMMLTSPKMVLVR